MIDTNIPSVTVIRESDLLALFRKAARELRSNEIALAWYEVLRSKRSDIGAFCEAMDEALKRGATQADYDQIFKLFGCDPRVVGIE